MGRLHPLNTLLILGDLTDAKDNHSARLVNRIVHALTDLNVKNVYVLKGNHDYALDGWPFFKFLRHLPGFHYIDSPTRVGEDILFLPHTRDPKKDWAGVDFRRYAYVFMHQTVSGAVASNGEVMEADSGLQPSFRAPRTKIFSGDIHVPQVVGDVEYVGSPYPVHFGDTFRGRVVAVGKEGSRQDLFLPTIRKVMLAVRSEADVEKAALRKGDQVKIRVDLPRSQRGEWHTVREAVLAAVREAGAVPCGIELVSRAPLRRLLTGDAEALQRSARTGPDSVLRRYAAHQKVDEETLAEGLELMK